jgi:hypothetical protein
MAQTPPRRSAEEIMIALLSAQSSCMESQEFIRAVVEGDKSVVLSDDGTWLVLYAPNKNFSDDTLVVDIPTLSDEAFQYEEIEAVDRSDVGALVLAIMNSDYYAVLEDAQWECFQKAVTGWAKDMATALTAALPKSLYTPQPIDWQGAGLQRRYQSCRLRGAADALSSSSR